MTAKDTCEVPNIKIKSKFSKYNPEATIVCGNENAGRKKNKKNCELN